MKPIICRNFRRAGFVSLLFLSLIAHAADFDTLIASARQQMEAGQYLDCLATAQNAIKESPDNYKGYYYAALALYKNDKLDEAQPFIDQAKAKAGAENAATVEKLVQAIGYKRTSLAEIKAGDAAMDDGLPGKAAEAYQNAWEAGNLNPDIGFKAASLYSGRLNDPVASMRILRQIVSKFPESKPGEDAAGELAKLAPSLAIVAGELYQRSMQASGDQRKELLLQSIEVDPNRMEAYRPLAQMAALSGDEASMYADLKELSKHGQLTVLYLTDDAADSYGRYLREPKFQKFIGDALGQQDLQALTASLDKQEKANDEKQRRERTQLDHDSNIYNKVKHGLDNNLQKFVGRWEPDSSGSAKGILTISRLGESGLTCTGQVSIKYSGQLTSCKVTSGEPFTTDNFTNIVATVANEIQYWGLRYCEIAIDLSGGICNPNIHLELEGVFSYSGGSYGKSSTGTAKLYLGGFAPDGDLNIEFAGPGGSPESLILRRAAK